MRAFFYGTLMSSGIANELLEGQTFLGEIATMPGYRVFDCGGFPGMVEDKRAGPVNGELWTVDAKCLARLDEYEGVAEGMYRRGYVALADRSQAVTYLFTGEATGLQQ